MTTPDAGTLRAVASAIELIVAEVDQDAPHRSSLTWVDGLGAALAPIEGTVVQRAVDLFLGSWKDWYHAVELDTHAWLLRAAVTHLRVLALAQDWQINPAHGALERDEAYALVKQAMEGVGT